MPKVKNNLTTKELLKGALSLMGSPGLKNAAMECSCDLDDLIPCQEDPSLCRVRSGNKPAPSNILEFPKGKEG